MRNVLLLICFVVASANAAWFRGNTHAHTLESDGDSSPEVVARWYADHGYDFLVITDHDKVTRVDDAPILLIPGEEVTDRLPKKPLHVNALGIDEPVRPQGGGSVVEVLQHDVDAVRAAGGIAAINHPNFGWAFGSAELLRVDGETLLEIASGHPFVNMGGPPSAEQMWDDLLTAGKRVWGIGVDDVHHLQHPWDADIAAPGKAWIVVRAEACSASAILAAIRAGDFYASTGVELSEIRVTDTFRVWIKAKNGAHYRTLFIGPGGKVLAESGANPATFPMTGATGYVRAKVIDSNGKTAWVQPHFLKK
jgi:hypothetical protein